MEERISPEYLDTLKIPLLAGRFFTDQDLLPDHPAVAVINQALAERHWPGQDPIGSRIVIHDGNYGLSEIVGVIGDVRRRGLDSEAPPVLYVPYHLNPQPVVALFARMNSDPGPLAEAIQDAIWDVEPNQPIYGIEPLSKVVGRSLTVPRLVQRLLGIQALLSLSVAALGIYSMLLYLVQTRRRELGVRVALGAAPRHILTLLLSSSFSTGLIGSAVGLGLAGAINSWLGPYLYGSDFGLQPYLASLGVILGAILLASGIPALSAARADPLRVLQAGRELR